MLGVCLGHQGLAHVRGGSRRARRGDRPRAHQPGLPSRRRASSPASRRAFAPCATTRSSSSPRCRPTLEAIAWADDGTLMAIRDRERRAWGVQFHPESVGTEHGERLIANFVALTPARAPARADARSCARRAVPGGREPLRPAAPSTSPPRLDGAPDAERAFAALFGEREPAFWLDSSLVDPKLSRFSFIGAAIGSLGAEVRYRVRGSRLTVTRDGGDEERTRRRCSRTSHASSRACTPPRASCRSTSTAASSATSATSSRPTAARPTRTRRAARRLPAARRPHRRVRPRARPRAPARAVGRDAARRSARRRRWLDDAAARSPTCRRSPSRRAGRATRGGRSSSCSRGRAHHLANVEACKRLLEAGESYEICLTNRIALAPRRTTRFELYRVLRRVNPAPYGAYLRMREGAVLSSSPERFLRVRPRPLASRPSRSRARPAARPIRAPTRAARDGLLRSPKDRAEHLMIVDLLRNDLGLVSQIGSIHVAQAHGRRELRERAPDGLDDPRAAARRRRPRRLHPRDVPRRLDDRRAEAAHDGDHRRPRGRARAASTPARSATSRSTARPT